MGSRWRLTAVTDDRGTTEIPSSVDAWLDLTADGELLASDDVNVTNGHITTTSIGFDVAEPITIPAGYAGSDPVKLAAITGIDAMTMAAGGQAAHVTVLSADREHLIVQTNGVRLTFVRYGPAGK
ncbi:hypothetical protein [Actinoplanes regularis]|uniref:META domain-containing protein n=1 Tax=Actinoplanes regularis TaxID=52697 RepID=A0A239EZ66_9ACTN|nr:hypothetical protein [Actinoplanes regularis]SNS49578.1 hypothetical protein SAMN06264365_116172 [Actinoplanes regularis]